jgi:DNA-binding MarR family transcriptional regulator
MEQRTRRKLNHKQLNVLLLLYKFRFTTAPQLTEYLGLKSNSIIRNLRVLLDQELIGWKYDLSYKIDRKPAVYYLEKKGLAILKENPSIDKKVLHSYYKNKDLDEEFIQHSIDVLAVCNALQTSYGATYYLFTKNELGGFADFPDSKPDVYLRHTDDVTEYFITLAHDIQPFITRKRLTEYIRHSEEEGWSSNTYPTLLYVFKNRAHEERFTEYAKQLLENSGIDEDELRIATTTIEALLSQPYAKTIWMYVGADTTPVALL